MSDRVGAAWATLGEGLRAFIRRRVPDPDDAEDILQDVFVNIHGGIDRLADETRLAAWIYQIARHAVTDYYRRRARTPAVADVPEDLPERNEPAPALVEIAACLEPLLKQLPEPSRRALALTELEDRPQRELAATLGLSVSGAKSRVQRARAQLKDLLLACCHFEFDRQGRIVAYEPRSGSCRSCADGPCRT